MLASSWRTTLAGEIRAGVTFAFGVKAFLSDQVLGLRNCVRTSVLRRPFITDLHRGTLSPRRLAAFLTPCKTALWREQRQRHSRFLFRFRLFWLFSFPVGSSLPFRHITFPYVDHRRSKTYAISY